jgi:hypothetical protein
MKLYTEEQVLKFINDNFDEGCSQLIGLTPIELPSDSLCINCDKSESTHNICMDCIIKIGKENIELPSDESLKDKLFNLADEFAFAGYGKTAVILHTIHNGLGNNEQEGGNNEQRKKH